MSEPEGPDDPMLRAAIRELRRPVDLGPGVDARVLAELRREGAARRAWHWLTRPRTVRVSPLRAAGLAAAVAAVSVLVVTAVRQVTAPRAEPLAVGAAPPGEVAFVLAAPAADRVSLVGDFNDWNPDAAPLTRRANGVWETALPLPPGRYRYTFIVDGTRWVRDPTEPPALDDFGTPTSVITVARR